MPQGFKPILQVIDNIERNHKLGLMFELNVDSGKLLVCMANLDVNNKLEVLQFYNSILNYMESAIFKPETVISTTDLQSLFSTEGIQGEIKSLQNISETDELTDIPLILKEEDVWQSLNLAQGKLLH